MLKNLLKNLLKMCWKSCVLSKWSFSVKVEKGWYSVNVFGLQKMVNDRGIVTPNCGKNGIFREKMSFICIGVRKTPWIGYWWVKKNLRNWWKVVKNCWKSGVFAKWRFSVKDAKGWYSVNVFGLQKMVNDRGIMTPNCGKNGIFCEKMSFICIGARKSPRKKWC